MTHSTATLSALAGIAAVSRHLEQLRALIEKHGVERCLALIAALDA